MTEAAMDPRQLPAYERRHDIASRTWGNAPDLRPGLTVVVWPESGHLYSGRVIDGPRMLGRRVFHQYLVRPKGERARWVSCTSIVSAVLPGGRLPA